jgi:uncharacterized protein (TIGR02246 family)
LPGFGLLHSINETEHLMLIFAATFLFITSTIAPGPAQEVVGLEQQLLDALVRSDTRTIASLWADDLAFVGTNGKTSSKAQRLAGMTRPPTSSDATVSSATNDDVKVRLYGQTAVVTLVSTWTTRAGNGEFSNRYMTTHVWVKQRGRWLLVSAHVSNIVP